MHLIARTAATTFTAALIAAVVAPAAGAATLAPAAGQTSAGTTTSLAAGLPSRDPDRCQHRFYRLRHEIYCHRHRNYS
jgi:hypothetical protein